MFRGLIILVEIVVLVVVLRSSFVQYLFSDIQKDISNWLIELSELPDKAELSALRGKVEPNIQAMKGFQKDYLNGVMDNRDSVNHFYQLYCVKGDKNPYIYGATLRYFCNEIQATKLLNSRPE